MSRGYPAYFNSRAYEGSYSAGPAYRIAGRDVVDAPILNYKFFSKVDSPRTAGIRQGDDRAVDASNPQGPGPNPLDCGPGQPIADAGVGIAALLAFRKVSTNVDQRSIRRSRHSDPRRELWNRYQWHVRTGARLRSPLTRKKDRGAPSPGPEICPSCLAVRLPGLSGGRQFLTRFGTQLLRARPLFTPLHS